MMRKVLAYTKYLVGGATQQLDHDHANAEGGAIAALAGSHIYFFPRCGQNGVAPRRVWPHSEGLAVGCVGRTARALLVRH